MRDQIIAEHRADNLIKQIAEINNGRKSEIVTHDMHIKAYDLMFMFEKMSAREAVTLVIRFDY